jgi:hypothetical protein
VIGANPKSIMAILVSMVCFRCSLQPKIEGEFGSVRAPNPHQIALIRLKAGDALLARKIQQEHDSLFMVLLDYSVREIAIDNIRSLEVRRMTAPESMAKNGSKISEDGKKEAAYLGFGCAQVFKNTVDGMKP